MKWKISRNYEDSSINFFLKDSNRWKLELESNLEIWKSILKTLMGELLKIEKASPLEQNSKKNFSQKISRNLKNVDVDYL
jgi:hypothetical protein